jgi:6-phosphogluconate dehydrogenase
MDESIYTSIDLDRYYQETLWLQPSFRNITFCRLARLKAIKPNHSSTKKSDTKSFINQFSDALILLSGSITRFIMEIFLIIIAINFLISLIAFYVNYKTVESEYLIRDALRDFFYA